MGQKFFDMHESSRLNMSFKCSGAFNIINVMRIRIAEGENFGCYITLDKGWRVINAGFSGHKLGSGHLNLALKKPSAARITDRAGAESPS